MSGLSTRQPNSEIQDMILTVTKSEKIKNPWKRSSCVFNMMRIPFHYIAISQKKKKKKISCTLKYNFNWTTAEQVEMGHLQWNGVLKMYRCMLWHLSAPDHCTVPIKFFQFLTCRNPPPLPQNEHLYMYHHTMQMGINVHKWASCTHVRCWFTTAEKHSNAQDCWSTLWACQILCRKMSTTPSHYLNQWWCISAE